MIFKLIFNRFLSEGNPKKSAPLRSPFQPLHDREDEHGGEEAERNKHTPHHPERHTCTPNTGDDAGEVVADSSHAEPQSHHHAFVFRRCHLRDERDADGTQQQLGEGQDEIGANQPIGRDQGTAHATLRLQFGWAG